MFTQAITGDSGLAVFREAARSARAQRLHGNPPVAVTMVRDGDRIRIELAFAEVVDHA